MGGIDELVAVVVVLLPPEVLHDGAHAAALRVPVDQPGPVLLVEGEQVQLPAQAAVVAPERLLDLLKVGLELLLRLEQGAVDALEHGVALAATPVRPRDVHQLERLHLSRALHVRPPAEVDEVAVPVQAHLLVLDLVDELQLVRLLREQLARLLPGHLLVHERHVGGHPRAHLLLDDRQVVRGQGPRQGEIVVEAGIDGRADAQLGVREHLQHGLGHDVGGGVPQPLQPLFFGHRVKTSRHASVLFLAIRFASVGASRRPTTRWSSVRNWSLRSVQ